MSSAAQRSSLIKNKRTKIEGKTSFWNNKRQNSKSITTLLISFYHTKTAATETLRGGSKHKMDANLEIKLDISLNLNHIYIYWAKYLEPTTTKT